MDEKIYITFNSFKNQLPLKINFPEQKKTKCQSQASSQWRKKTSLVKNTTSLGSNEFSLGKGPSFSKKRTPSLENNVFFLGKCLSSLRKHMFQIFLQSQSSHFCFYMLLQPIIGKVLKKVTTLQVEIFQSEFICKHYDQTKF